MISSSVASPESATKALGTSPASSSGRPTTAASATAGCCDEHRLELGRRHLVALVLDELLDAVDEHDVAVVVGAADVAGVQPAVGVDRGGGRLRVVEVAAHDLRPAHADLALLARAELVAAGDVDDPALGVGHRRADRPEPVARGIERRDVGDRAGLGHAVALHHRAADALRGGLLQLGAQRRGARVDERQAREVEALDDRALGQGEDDRRDEVGLRGAVLLHEAEEALEVEARHRDERRAVAQDRVHDHGQAVDVEERQDADERVVGGHGLLGGRLQDVGHQVAVGEHHALGQARGPARVGQRDEVVGLGGRLGRRGGIAVEQRGERRRPVRLAEDVELLDAGAARRLARAVERRPGPLISARAPACSSWKASSSTV